MSIVTVLVKKLMGLVFMFVGIFKKMLCFLHIKRGRKNSGSILPMHNEPIAVPQSVPSNDEVELESWDNWVEGSPNNNPAVLDPNPIPSQSTRRPVYPMQPVFLSNKMEGEPEPDIDFFEDMTPQIKKAAKILVKKREDHNGSAASHGMSNRLAMTNDVHLKPIDMDLDGGDSNTWTDGLAAGTEDGWGEEAMEDLSWQAESHIKDKKRQERERKISEHQRRKMEKEMTRGEGGRVGAGQFSAVKLS